MRKSIIFVCNGNIHRSVVAENSLAKILKEKGLASNFSVASYGLQGSNGTSKPRHKKLKEYPKEYKAALPALIEFQININRHSWKRITSSAVKRADVIIAMDKKTYSDKKNSLVAKFIESKHKIHLFSELTKNHRGIPDPSGSGSPALHRAVIKNIYSTIKNTYRTILGWAG